MCAECFSTPDGSPDAAGVEAAIARRAASASTRVLSVPTDTAREALLSGAVGGSSLSWECPECTLLNGAEVRDCEACKHPRHDVVYDVLHPERAADVVGLTAPLVAATCTAGVDTDSKLASDDSEEWASHGARNVTVGDLGGDIVRCVSDPSATRSRARGSVELGSPDYVAADGLGPDEWACPMCTLHNRRSAICAVCRYDPRLESTLPLPALARSTSEGGRPERVGGAPAVPVTPSGTAHLVDYVGFGGGRGGGAPGCDGGGSGGEGVGRTFVGTAVDPVVGSQDEWLHKLNDEVTVEERPSSTSRAEAGVVRTPAELGQAHPGSRVHAGGVLIDGSGEMACTACTDLHPPGSDVRALLASEHPAAEVPISSAHATAVPVEHGQHTLEVGLSGNLQQRSSGRVPGRVQRVPREGAPTRSPEPWLCDHCGSANSPSAYSLCRLCYKARSDPVPPGDPLRVWLCPKCGTANDGGRYLCWSCPRPTLPVEGERNCRVRFFGKVGRRAGK